MNFKPGISALLLAALVAPQLMCGALAKDPNTSSVPFDSQSTSTVPDNPPSAKPVGGMGGLSAPGANAMMTPDMLLINPNPNPNAPKPEPLKAYIGVSVTLKVERYDIEFDRLQGILIEVVNETDRPLVINGNKATATAGGAKFTAAPVSALQNIVIPPHTAQQIIDDIFKSVIPAAVTIGAAPTIRDIKQNNKPVLERYGADELRRRVESTRFGRRVLWPHEKTRGVLYFDTQDSIDKAHIDIPTSTLFDMTDAGVLSTSP
ncbi:MAG TPA: hypothetical protein V6C69_00655 [Trichormus sp.]|jgi:hypothetical protein